MNFGIGEWLRGRAIAWLAGSGGAGIVLVVDGARHVTVRQAGTVDVAGGYVVARGCKVVQNSTGEKILAEPQQSAEVEEINLQAAKDRIMREHEHKIVDVPEIRQHFDEMRNVGRKRRKKTIDAHGWETHNVGSDTEEK